MSASLEQICTEKLPTRQVGQDTQRYLTIQEEDDRPVKNQKMI